MCRIEFQIKHFTIGRAPDDFVNLDTLMSSLVSYKLFPAPQTYPAEANINMTSMNAF